MYGCALALLNGVVVKGNMAQGAGGIYVWSDLPVKPAPAALGARDGDVGASILIVASSQILSNSALYNNGSEDVLVRHHLVILLAWVGYRMCAHGCCPA